jgi:hypothetical protein
LGANQDFRELRKGAGIKIIPLPSSDLLDKFFT